MYETGDIAYIEILFGSQNFSDFISKMEVVSQLVEYDQDILNKLEEGKKKVAKAKADIEGILQRQEDNKKTLAGRKTALEKNLSDKERIIEELSKVLRNMKLFRTARKRRSRSFIRQHQAAASYAANPVKYTRRQICMARSLKRKNNKQLRLQSHPVHKTKKFHSGLDIGAAYGTDIVAAADGTVTLATVNGGYGKCIVINHGSGISTLYGHNSSLLVSSGAKVTRGQVIAKAGSTGVSTGPHCHFEVRINGATTDPLQYLR